MCDLIHEVLAETQAGKLIFPEVVGRLLEVGVESYFCDLATGVETFYLSNGQTQAEKMILPLSPVAAEFSSSEVIAAIREAQAEKIRYPEFGSYQGGSHGAHEGGYHSASFHGGRYYAGGYYHGHYYRSGYYPDDSPFFVDFAPIPAVPLPFPFLPVPVPGY